MARATPRSWPRFVPPVILILLANGLAFAENIDPVRDGSKFAGSENPAWINFAPATCAGDPTCGVKISPTTGEFSGRALRLPLCDRLASGGSGSHEGSDHEQGQWHHHAAFVDRRIRAATYDIVHGGRSALRSANGNFGFAATACAVDNTPGTSFDTGLAPGVGDGYWFLVRACNCDGSGT